MERERAKFTATAIGNGLLVTAGVLTAIGLIVIWRLGLAVDNRFGFGGDGGEADFDDYLFAIWPYVLGLATSAGIIGGLGLVFRWLALEQEAKMEEFDRLLDALGVPVEGEDGPTEELPDA